MADNPQTQHLWDSSGQITSTGSANAYVIATAEPITGYYQGMPPIRFKANFTNSGSATVDVNGLGAVTLKKEGGATNLASGDIVSGGIYTLSHDGTNFQVLELNSVIPPAAVDGVSNGLRWNFDSSTAMADPGTGDFRLNNATLASVTAIAVSDLTGETSNPDASPWVLAWDDSTNTVRGTLAIKKRGAEQNFAVYNITGASTDNSGWTQLAVTHVVSNGSFTNADACELTFSRAGNVGAAGANGTGGVITVVIQTFTATGTYTPTTGMLYCIVEAQAPGGGGGGGDSDNAASTPPSNAGGGGGGGEYARGVFSAATIGASQAVTIGAVGTAGTTVGSNGGAGGTTSLGALLTANGGSGGVGTGSNSASRVARAGGAGGTGGSGGALRVPGGAGSAGFGYCTVPTSGSEAYSVVIGQGGSGVLGKPSAQGTGADITGSAGQNYGSGGNGGADDDNTGSAGGAGGPGIIVITEFVA